jgi:hypothetical protein
MSIGQFDQATVNSLSFRPVETDDFSRALQSQNMPSFLSGARQGAGGIKTHLMKGGELPSHFRDNPVLWGNSIISNFVPEPDNEMHKKLLSFSFPDVVSHSGDNTKIYYFDNIKAHIILYLIDQDKVNLRNGLDKVEESASSTGNKELMQQLYKKYNQKFGIDLKLSDQIKDEEYIFIGSHGPAQTNSAPKVTRMINSIANSQTVGHKSSNVEWLVNPQKPDKK